MFRAVYDATNVPGLSAAVGVGDELVWEENLGKRDIEAGARVTSETRFRIGSVSKAVTAVALVRLWQAGRIDLDADVRTYVPEFPDKGYTITPRMLAGHLGGIRNYQQKDFEDSTHIDRRHFPTTTDALTIFKDDSLVAEPGGRYRYSVFGYTLLSAAMERAGESDFLELLQQYVTDPLELQNTGADTGGVLGRAATYERASDGGASLAEPLDFSYKWAGGGLYSNAGDLARLGIAILNPDFITQAGLDLLTTSQSTTDGERTNVSFGWRLGEDSRGRRFIHHAGSISGGRAVILVYPDEGVSVALTSNQALAPLMVEATTQIVAEPFLLEQTGPHFSQVRQVGRYDYIWSAGGTDHTGTLLYGGKRGKDRIDLHPGLALWAERLGSPVGDTAQILPMILTGKEALIPVITAAGAFGIDVSIHDDDRLSGEVAGQFVRVSGEFRAERVE